MFNKLLASVGIGSAKVDTKLAKDQYRLGEEVTGVIDIQGGSTQQQIDEIYLSVHTTYEVEHEIDDEEHTYQQVADIKRHLVNESFTIGKNEKKTIPFTFQLPFETPLTYGKTKVWIKTGLDIKKALDPGDKDYIKVVATPLVQEILNTMDALGFRLNEVDCEKKPSHFPTKTAYVQEFEFVPVNGQYKGRLTELELIFIVKNDNELELSIQLDRKRKGLGFLLGDSEHKTSLSITSRDQGQLQQKINQLIQSYL